tara:strand:+ start:252082 stop:252951 length:870 start_codon:yes stop_codon:yes gene_type:complete
MDVHPVRGRSSSRLSRPFGQSLSGEFQLKISKRFVALAVVLFSTSMFAGVCAADETGDLKIRFVYGGDAPAAKPINADKDADFCGKHGLVDESLVVNPENKGIKNVVVYVYTGSRGTDLPKQTPANATHTLANLNCRFEPHVVICQVGDTLKVTNPDPVGHNANLKFFNNTAQNFMIPAKQEKSVTLEEAEPALIPVECNIHPWMKANILVVDHPFAAVSDEDGYLEIKGLPAGKEIIFRASHDSGTFRDEIIINGKKDSWRSNKFEVEIKPGMNDMGTVEMPPAAFED